MDAMMQLIVSSVAFVGTHFVLSHPLRAPLVAKFGEGAFRAFYALVALATLAWTIWAYRAAPAHAAYVAGDRLWIIASALMWVASILLVGSFVGNPALPAPGALAAATRAPKGVFAITRHPMMWSFAIWALVHLMIAPSVRNHVLMPAILILALGGAAGQDVKKARLVGEAWRTWRARTAFFPFGAQLRGQLSWGAAIPSWGVFAIATLFWLFATYGHAEMGVPAAGIWRWAG
jgi:uncharacterized membrane protein